MEQPRAIGADRVGGHAGAEDGAGRLAQELVDRDRGDIEFAQRLRVAMDGDTPACAALKLGVGQRSVARAFGSGRASAHLLRRICAVYGVDGHWLLTGLGERRARQARVQPACGLPSENLLAEVSTRLASLLTELEHFRSHGAGG